jgi:hypothetical protein
MSGKSLLPAGYGALLAEVKQRVCAAQIKAAVSANRELILLYWDIGCAIVEAQKDKGYGKQVVESLAADLRREFPMMTGLSALNHGGCGRFTLPMPILAKNCHSL